MKKSELKELIKESIMTILREDRELKVMEFRNKTKKASEELNSSIKYLRKKYL